MSASLRLDVVVRAGNRREALTALRDHLADALVEVDPRYKAPLASQLRDTLRELADLPDVKVVTPLDELRNRRAARGSAASSQ